MQPPHRPSQQCNPTRTRILRATLAGLAGVAAALLVACGGTGKALIPVAHAGPLLNDFEAVRDAAENAAGDCSTTEAALRKTEEDFAALPSTVDSGLRNNLHLGISNLRVRAHELCIQPTTQTTTTATTEKTTTTATTPTTTTSTETQTATTPTTPAEAPETPGPGGGTPAPGVGETPVEEETQGGGVGPGGGVGEDGQGQGKGHAKEGTGK
ncbi:MAG: hypothetical protein ACYDHN_09890 [Solirubrobacteraceae bacterium]